MSLKTREQTKTPLEQDPQVNNESDDKFKNYLPRQKITLIILLPISLILLTVASLNQDFAQWYSMSVYLFLSMSLDIIFSVAPFSFFEILIIAFIVISIVYIIRFINKLIRYKEKRKETLIKFFSTICICISMLLFIYTITTGINAHRIPFAQSINLQTTSYSNEQLKELSNYLVDEINELNNYVDRDENGIMNLANDINQTSKIVAQDYQIFARDYDTLSGVYLGTKYFIFSDILSSAQILGVYSFVTTEANINQNIPHYAIPSTMAHELTHKQGYMLEDEANFIAFLVCDSSKHYDVKYSGYMMALQYVTNGLNSEDYTEIMGRLNENSINDIRYYIDYFKSFEGPIADISTTVNDTYLKASGQEDGVKSYGMVTDLLLEYYIQNIK